MCFSLLLCRVYSRLGACSVSDTCIEASPAVALWGDSAVKRLNCNLHKLMYERMYDISPQIQIRVNMKK